jgi:HSP20 family molecular chaperone IbpA
MPLIDIHDTPDGLVLEADLPGATDEAVNILLEANVLSLKVEVLPDIEPGARLLHQEYPVPGVFQRSFILSDEVDRSRISAELRNGVLRLHLPKAERTAARRIEVKNQ